MIEEMQGQKTGYKGLSPRVLVGDVGKELESPVGTNSEEFEC